MALLLLFIVFVCVPVLELWLILQVADLLGGGATGVALTIALLIFDSLLGAWLLRSQGRSVWRQLRATLEARRLPAREVIDGGFVVVGGVLLLTPGFLTDIVGVLMLVPPTRKVFRNWVYAFAARRVTLGASRMGSWRTDDGLRDFSRSNQPPRPPAGGAPRAHGPAADGGTDFAAPEAAPDFDFETKRLNN